MFNTFNFESQNEAECMLHFRAFNFLAFFFRLRDFRQYGQQYCLELLCNVNRPKQEMTTLFIFQFISLFFLILFSAIA